MGGLASINRASHMRVGVLGEPVARSDLQQEREREQNGGPVSL